MIEQLVLRDDFGDESRRERLVGSRAFDAGLLLQLGDLLVVERLGERLLRLQDQARIAGAHDVVEALLRRRDGVRIRLGLVLLLLALEVLLALVLLKSPLGDLQRVGRASDQALTCGQ